MKILEKINFRQPQVDVVLRVFRFILFLVFIGFFPVYVIYCGVVLYLCTTQLKDV